MNKPIDMEALTRSVLGIKTGEPTKDEMITESCKMDAEAQELAEWAEIDPDHPDHIGED